MGTISVKVGGDSIAQSILVRAEVQQKLNSHDTCCVVCRETEDARPPIESYLGQDLQITTDDENDGEVTLFDGFVLDVSLKYEIYGSYTARIVGVSRSFKMDITERSQYYLEKPLSAIANQLAGNDGLQATVQCADMRPLNYVQWAETDFSFLNRLADHYGAWLRPTAQGIEISDQFTGSVEVKWREEFGLKEFTTRGRLAPALFNGAHYHHHAMKSQSFEKVKDDPPVFGSVGQLVDAVKAQSQNLPPGYVHQRSRVVTLDDYNQLLKKESARSVGSCITAEGTSSQPKLRPGSKVQISGVLDAEGLYGIIAVNHTWTPDGYDNSFECTPWQKYTNPDPPQIRQWHGLVPARVVDHNDPKKMGRIRVQYLWQEDGPAYWARMVTPHAGSGRGFMFMPEKGDEVVVGFEDGDPERPIIVGCLWNGVDQAPRFDFAKDDITPNDVKRIVTKSGNRLQMVDTPGKESVTLSTPNSVKVLMAEASASPTGRETLVLQVDRGDIILNAPQGRIHLHAQYYSREIGGMPPAPPPASPHQGMGFQGGLSEVGSSGPSGPGGGLPGPGPVEET